MKILALRFKNLNSLYGEWNIDFTDPEYISNGIFALTGPTGAGKSTILDAICLALYGATPRLRKITKSGNEIMSRQTGECFAEVLFESQAGRFRCHWAQHRSRRKAGGELQSPRHEIAEGIEGGSVLETQIRRVQGAVEEKTGMDFDQFTRSILLAQGGFDTFLKADVEQKSRILEQITGTEIYSEISRRVHERQRDEREKLNLLQAETSGIAILEPEQEQAVREELAGNVKQQTELAAQSAATAKAIAWLTGITGLKHEIHSLSEESAKLQVELESFNVDRERLARAQKAAAFDGHYATLTAVRKQQAVDQATLTAEEIKLPKIEALAGQTAEDLKAADERTRKAKEELKQSAPLITKARSLDQQIADKQKIAKSLDAACRGEREQVEADTKKRMQEQAKLETAYTNLKGVQAYLVEHAGVEWLVSGLAGIEEQAANLLAAQQEIAAKAVDELKAGKNLTTATDKLKRCTESLAARRKEVEDAGKKLEQGKQALASILNGRLLREYHTEKETLLREMAFLATIAKLEDHRRKLEDGKPCPLCGSEEHPYAAGNLPKPDETEKKIESLNALIQKAEAQEAVIKKLEQIEKDALKSLADAEVQEAAVAHNMKSAEKALNDLGEELTKTRARCAELEAAVLAKLQPLGITEIPKSDVAGLVSSLKARLAAWQEQVQQKTSIEKQIADAESELKKLDAVLETRTKGLTEKQETLDVANKEYANGCLERQELFGTKSPDVEEVRLNRGVVHAEAAEKQARVVHDEAKQALNAAQANLTALRKQIEARCLELAQQEPLLAEQLHAAGFVDEQAFLAACLAVPERDQLASMAKVLDDRQIDLQARRKDRTARLSAEIEKKMTEATLEELTPVHEEQEEGLKLIRATVAGLEHKLAENVAAKARIQEKQSAIEAQQVECGRWEKLHGLIGSADGKKYRNFAQGLTFELMVAHANRQLEKMTDRYLLIRDDQEPLELNVVDNYQAGEIRSTRNLSGGESFIVSLTLALGLSKMASRKVRVDSLFLDEGFGTLDEEALETALETLAGLQQDGKLIGIISHVPALKERISTQIAVVPGSGGKSVVMGPGCRKL